MSILPASGIGDESTGFYPFKINQSIRFNDDDSPQLSKTFGTPTSNTKMIYATWFKTTETASHQSFFSGGSNSLNYMLFALSTASFYSNSDMIFFGINTSNVGRLRLFGSTSTGPFFRDSTNWYHILLAIDTTQATNTDRIHVFVNGKKITTWGSTIYPSQDYSVPLLNTAIAHNFGFNKQDAVSSYGSFDGYFAETYFLDGQSIFSDTSGSINSTFLADANTLAMFCEQKNGVAVPKSYSGTFGNNGVKLTYADSSSLGDDTSGNGNDFTSSGLASTDVVIDSPTNNFCTLNPLSGGDHDATLSEGALKASGNDQAAIGTFGMTSGKWYWEGRCGSIGGSNFIGIVKMNYVDKDQGSSHTSGRTYANNGSVYTVSVTSFATGTTYTTGDIIGVAVDLDNGTIKWYKNGTENTNSEVTDLNSHADGDQGWLPWTNFGNATGDFVLNFGQDSSFTGLVTAQNNSDGNGQGDFYYTPPSGYLALCSSNLPEVTISPSKATQGDDHFNTVLYTGNGTGQTISGVGFQPDWTWNKNRDQADFHILQDSVRGAGKEIFSNSTADVETYSTSITSFNTDGFVLGSREPINANNEAYVSYNWKAGGAPSADNSAGAGNTPTSNSVKIDGSNLGSALAGTIPATRLSANTTAGFSIVTYTGTGSAGTLAHGLTSAPEMIWFKQLNANNDWMVYNKTIGNNRFLYLNLTNGQTGTSSSYFDDTDPSSTVISLKDYHRNNDSSDTYVAYAFHSVDGYSKIGTYTGNGETSADGTYVFLGFRPQWVLIKRTDSSSGWLVWNNKVSTFNPVDDYVAADSSAVEQTGSNTQRIDFLSNGFKAVNTSTSNTINGSGTTHIYMAFAEQPFKFSNAR